jgi:hypothetical protein
MNKLLPKLQYKQMLVFFTNKLHIFKVNGMIGNNV